MKLDKKINYIVSGIERSGTSMLMQILYSGKIGIGFDESRPSDKYNPKGYYELVGGKIINKLINGSFPLDDYTGTFIKITAYGLKFLPSGNYRIIYSERNIEEILDSMEKMADIVDKNRDETRESFIKLNNMIKKQMEDRKDIEFLLVDYNDMILYPKNNIKKILDFLGLPDFNIDKMIATVDKTLYRQRRTNRLNNS
jgi:hypothetical protein